MTSSPDLTVAMCFLNEREQVRQTVASVRETVGGAVEILLLNDGSDPDYDYRAVAREYGCRYLENGTRLGPAACRGLIVDAVETPMVLLVDAHVRFYDASWARTIVDAVSASPRALYCARSAPLDPVGQATGGQAGLGAWMTFAPDPHQPVGPGPASSVLEPKWNTVVRSGGPIETVPVVLGGAYAFDRAFFQEIGGLLGLAMYGGDEAFLSSKAWLAGGGCYALSEVTVGHIYRTPATSAPFVNPPDFFVYNKMVLLATVFPETTFEGYRRWMQATPVYEDAVAIFRRNQCFLRRLRRHFEACVFRHPFAYFETLNEDFRAGADITDRVGP